MDRALSRHVRDGCVDYAALRRGSQDLDAWLAAAARTAHLSPLFKWYMADFGGSKAAVLRYLKPWLAAEEGWAVEWTGYDWSLNEERR